MGVMHRRLRQVKSETSSRFIRRKVKTERTATPMRYSRRLRHLPPEHSFSFFNKKKSKLEGKHIISKESSIQFRPSRKGHRQRKLNYPQRVKNSKEVISIFSAPRICNKKVFPSKKIMQVPMQVRGSSCRPKVVVKDKNALRTHYTVSKCCVHIKREPLQGTEKVFQNRKKYVLEVLNKGDMKDIERLPTVGSKTAERIILYRQLKGSINRVSELANMPNFPKGRFHNFVDQNFLKVD